MPCYLANPMPLSVSTIARSVFSIARRRHPPLLCSAACNSARAARRCSSALRICGCSARAVVKLKAEIANKLTIVVVDVFIASI